MNSRSPESIPFPELVLRRAIGCAAYLACAAAAVLVLLAFFVDATEVRAFAQPTTTRCAALQTGPRAPQAGAKYAECLAELRQNTTLDKRPFSEGALASLIVDGFFRLMAAIRGYVLLSLALGLAWAVGERLGPPLANAWRQHRLG